MRCDQVVPAAEEQIHLDNCIHALLEPGLYKDMVSISVISIVALLPIALQQRCCSFVHSAVSDFGYRHVLQM